MSEITYQEFMQEKVQPFLETNVKSGQLPSKHKAKVQYYYAIHPNMKGSITIVHGFCEFFAKYHEMFYKFYEQGYSVFFLELRGHGLSSRDVKDPSAVYVHSYDDYVEDVKNVTDQIVLPLTKGVEHIIFSHSMGGCVTALYLKKYSGHYDKVIFSSPMFMINYRGVKPWQVKSLATLSDVAKLEKKLIPNATHFTGEDEFENSSALDHDRYNYMMDHRRANTAYQTWSATYGWTIASKEATEQIPECAKKIEIPVLLLQAGSDTMVDNKGQDQFASLSKTTTLIKFPHSKHEIFNATDEIREKYYDTIFKFIGD